MKTTTSLLAVAASVLGLGAGAAAFQLTASSDPGLAPTSQTVVTDKPKVTVPKIHPGTQFHWAPCEPPAVQEGDACVVDVVQTVVVPAAPQPPAGGATSAGSTSGSGGGPATYPSDDSDDDEYDESDDERDDDDEDEGDEREDEREDD